MSCSTQVSRLIDLCCARRMDFIKNVKLMVTSVVAWGSIMAVVQVGHEDNRQHNTKEVVDEIMEDFATHTGLNVQHLTIY